MRTPSRKNRPGMTLIELLIVISMLIIIVSVTTAMMQPVLADKEIREGARQLNAYVAGAIARAAELGRPSGIWIQRMEGTPNAAFEVFYADEPPPYAGDTASAGVYRQPFDPVTRLRFNQSLTPLVQSGDYVQVNYKGPWYRIVGTPSDPDNVTIDISGKPAPPQYPLWTPFQIRRQPRKSSLKPLEMPNNTTIDLANSGIGMGGQATAFAGATGPVAIMFNPNGSVDRVYYNGTSTAVTSSVFLLVGRLEDLGAGNLGTGPNECRWISVNHQTGTVLTTENMGVDIATGRQFGRAGKGMGG